MQFIIKLKFFNHSLHSTKKKKLFFLEGRGRGGLSKQALVQATPSLIHFSLRFLRFQSFPRFLEAYFFFVTALLSLSLSLSIISHSRFRKEKLKSFSYSHHHLRFVSFVPKPHFFQDSHMNGCGSM